MRFLTYVIAALFAPSMALAVSLLGPGEAVDGDTLRISGETVRLLSIDAPESGQSCAHGACGTDSTAYLEMLLARGDIHCHGTRRDAYGRLLARCEVGQQDIGQAMVLAGHAVVFRRYSSDYLSEEADARARKAGLWADPAPQMPWDFRAARWQVTTLDDVPGKCPIKGNINRDGGRIYHLPYSRHYDRTRISPDRGERWFCTEAEAVAAGWRRARG